MIFAIFYAALLFSRALAQATPDLSNVTMAFSSAQVVPNVLPSFNPTDAVNVTFTDSVTMEDVTVVPGILLTMEQTAMEPDIFLIPTNSSDNSNVTTWVVALVDPDAPTPQNRSISQFLHFLGGDFTADGTGLLTNTSPALMEFTPPAPPAGSDPHRYILLVFDQPDSFDMDGSMFVNASTPRTNFNISSFAQSVNLGDPIAGNYFLVGPANDSATASSTTPAGSSISGSQTTLPLTVPSVTAPLTSPASPTISVTAPLASPTSQGIMNIVQIRFQIIVLVIGVFIFL